MIIKSGFEFTCDHKDCKQTATFNGNIVAAIEDARAKGWAIARDRRTCYCPQHANRYRNMGSMCGYYKYGY